jgi:hypothetical protein
VLQYDVTAPGTVTDLVAGAGSDEGSVLLEWTAPGDDGAAGTAAAYIIRYGSGPIGEAEWPTAADVAGAPAPAVAGTRQSLVIDGLTPGQVYWFAMKVQDDAGLVSGLSGSAEAEAYAPIPVSEPSIVQRVFAPLVAFRR